MKSYKAGAVFYVLWGAIHVLGGLSILSGWIDRGARGAAEAMTGGAVSAAEVAASINGIVGYHFYNIMWLGAVVAVVAIVSNWHNSRTGFWTNLALVGLTDIGLIIFMLVPGHISWAEGMIGIGLFVPAAILSFVGLRQPVVQHSTTPNSAAA